MQSMLAPQTGRLDRTVRRSFLRLDEGVSRHRVAWSLEEALRLASLSGEEEGRVYCFRRVSLAGIPVDANRRVWGERVERLLTFMAAQAVHASDANASAADGVYFNHIEEALESLLSTALRGAANAVWERPAWFSNSLLGLESETCFGRQIPVIVERLQPPAFSPGVAASILFAALGDIDPVVLLSAIPAGDLRAWMRTAEANGSTSGDTPAVRLPQRLATALVRAASQCGWKDPSTIWLAMQAVLSVAPGSMAAGTAVKRARATLRKLEAEQSTFASDRLLPASAEAQTHVLVFDGDEQNENRRSEPHDALHGSPLADEPNDPHQAITPIQMERSKTHLSDAQVLEPESSTLEASSNSDEVPHVSSSWKDRSVNKPTPSPLTGTVTHAAGLFFLLNALQRAGISRTLHGNPMLAEASLVAHVLRRLASQTGVDHKDPILLCFHSPQEPFTLDAEVLAALPHQPDAWPVGFAASSRASISAEAFLRVWSLAARRWCWRAGRLTLREIVQRTGRVGHTRTDIDVTLPLSAADIRIRRIGLDIDPGWLPWFGVHGRVVRFHYRDRQPGESSC